MSGVQVRFGVWMKIDLVAVLMMCKMKALSGVGGGVDVERGCKIRFAWWGEGSRTVCTGGVSGGKVTRLMREVFKASVDAVGSDGVISAGNEDSPVPSLTQNASQKS